VFKIHFLTSSEITFALANGGHNRGIVAPPEESGRYFRIATTAAKDRRPDPDAWANSAQRDEHSWWPAWFDWLSARSSRLVVPPPLGSGSAGYAPLAPAPGDYVHG
jgi:polyhydroxyalkanoate synthase